MTRKAGSNVADTLKRENAAVELHKSGWSYRAIAEKLGVTPTQAHRDVKNAIKALNATRLETTQDYVTVELERLNMLTKGLEPMAAVGNTMAVTAYVKVMEQRAKLLGLYAPEKKDLNINLSELTDDELRAIAEGKG